MALVALVPGYVMLLVGFVAAVLIGISRIGFWKTAILWCVVIGVAAAGVMAGIRARRKR